MTERWRQLLDQLGQELEQQAAQLKDLEDKNRQLLDAEAARKGRLSHASRDSEDSIEVEGGDVVPNVIPRNYHERGSRVSVMDSMEVDPLVPNPPPSLLRPQRPSQASVASLADATKLLAAEKMQLSVLRAEKTIEFAAQRPWWVINPDSNRFSHVWQVVTNFALAFVALVTPLQVGLLEIDWDALFVITWCVDIVFMIDMVLQFITMYPRTTARGMELEYRPSKIAKHYMMTWFCLDFATLIPLDTIGLLAGADRLKDLRSIKIIRVLRLLKLMRLLRSSKLTHRIEIPVSIPYQHVALLRFLLVLILACHWLACVWAMTLKLVDEKYPQWINEIELADAPYGIVTRESPLRIYIASYYFCCYTMTSVGYGDFGPRNVLERMACTWIGDGIGPGDRRKQSKVCAIVSEMTAESQRFRKKMHHLNSLMEEQGLPASLRCRLRSFFLQNRHQAQHLTRQKLLDHLSPQLHAEVCTALNLPWIQKVTFFRQFMGLVEALEMEGIHTAPFRACIAEVSRELKVAAFAQREIFDNVQVLYILSKGLVALNSRVGQNGVVWGEDGQPPDPSLIERDFVLSDTSLIRPVAGFALTYIEVRRG
ncbi:Potassium channel GORK (Guard cell outward rectifying K(+) channel) (AtGORK) [Durusdinium trenchii]|uniref:Potassium channel GORK (Guard cell outward rectifying K(+) channel) (AtGORK) n=1 Tax=Durusdinium trenchii TaxID=1381693 RepID=A0ABP0M8I7_9DINO